MDRNRDARGEKYATCNNCKNFNMLHFINVLKVSNYEYNKLDKF